MARAPTGNPRGRYRDPANESVACSYGCGKTGRKGPIVAHERHYCPKRPGAAERDTREGTSRAPPAAPPPPRAPPAPAAPRAPGSPVKVTRERVELRTWAPVQGA